MNERDIVSEKGAPGGPDPRALLGARFVVAAAALDQLPPPGPPEVAFAGRSNAGKSSAINVLAGRRRLAFASRTPGRTQQIVIFELPSGARIADLGRPVTDLGHMSAEVGRGFTDLGGSTAVLGEDLPGLGGAPATLGRTVTDLGVLQRNRAPEHSPPVTKRPLAGIFVLRPDTHTFQRPRFPPKLGRRGRGSGGSSPGSA